MAQAQGRIKRQLEQDQAQRDQAAKVPKKEQISVNAIVEELKIQDESGEVSTRLKQDLWNLLLKNKIQKLWGSFGSFASL